MITAGIILAGGRSERLGQPKELVKVNGLTLLQATVEACAVCAPVVVVGPRRTGLPDRVVQVREDPPFAGPLAAIRTGVAQLPTRGRTLVLACDMPRIGEIVAKLHGEAHQLASADAVLLRDRGEAQPMAGLWRIESLRRALRSRSDHAPVRSLTDDLRCHLADVTHAITHDIDEPADLAALWPSGSVAAAMVTKPSAVSATAPVSAAARALRSSHVHLAIVTDGPRVVSTILLEDLAAARTDLCAAQVGTLDGRTTRPDANLREVATEMVTLGQRRRVVVDDEANLLGLLCLNRRGDGFCSDENIAARASDRNRSPEPGSLDRQ